MQHDVLHAPQRLGPYEVRRVFVAGRTYRAVDSAGREVVLKLLEPDCLLKGQLHPNIHDRLARVRELAMTNLASLYGVERDPNSGQAYLVWQWIEGVPLEEYLAEPGRTPLELARVLRELATSLEALHALGLVHGAMHGRNVFVTDPLRGAVCLTHVSPLLHHDFGRDEAALLELIRTAAAREGREEQSTPSPPQGTSSLSSLAQQATQRHVSLRWLAAQLTALIDPNRSGAIVEAVPEPRKRLRFGSILAAILLAAAGIWLTLYLRQKLYRPPAPPPVPPVLKPAAH